MGGITQICNLVTDFKATSMHSYNSTYMNTKWYKELCLAAIKSNQILFVFKVFNVMFYSNCSKTDVWVKFHLYNLRKIKIFNYGLELMIFNLDELKCK